MICLQGNQLSYNCATFPFQGLDISGIKPKQGPVYPPGSRACGGNFRQLNANISYFADGAAFVNSLDFDTSNSINGDPIPWSKCKSNLFGPGGVVYGAEELNGVLGLYYAIPCLASSFYVQTYLDIEGSQQTSEVAGRSQVILKPGDTYCIICLTNVPGNIFNDIFFTLNGIGNSTYFGSASGQNNTASNIIIDLLAPSTSGAACQIYVNSSNECLFKGPISTNPAGPLIQGYMTATPPFSTAP